MIRLFYLNFVHNQKRVQNVHKKFAFLKCLITFGRAPVNYQSEVMVYFIFD